jgi:hypothetical protein
MNAIKDVHHNYFNKSKEDEKEIHSNTLHFINLSLNAAEQNRKISYRPEGLPKKSAEEERKHRELVHQTKKDYIESLKKEERRRKEIEMHQKQVTKTPHSHKLSSR